jgi:hypothetical protein
LPSFSNSHPDLRASGPLVEVYLSVPASLEQRLLTDGKPVPAPLKVLALVDTGASATSIQDGWAAKLGLQPVGMVKMTTPTSVGVDCLTYAVRMVLPEGITFETVASEAPLVGQGFEVLIGRDALAFGVLIYLGKENRFTLAF